MRKILALLVLASTCAFAQTAAIPTQSASVNASRFSLWELKTFQPVGAGAGQQVVMAGTSQLLPGGILLTPFKVGAPITFSDGANTEKVTPTNVVGCSQDAYLGQCVITATFAHPHQQGTRVTSGTAGLQEAINYLQNNGGSVLVDNSWGGNTGMITAATTVNSAVTITDVRTGVPLYYQWNGSAYIAIVPAAGGVSIAGVPTPGQMAQWLTSASIQGITLVPIANGGTNTATPALVQGTDITISGTWPNQTISTGLRANNNTWSGTNNFSAATTLSSATATSVTVGSINNVIQVDGAVYPFTSAGVNAAIAAACTGAPGAVMLPPQVISGLTAEILIPASNCTIMGLGKNVSVLKAGASLGNGGVLGVSATGFSHIRLINFGVDGNRSGNSNTLDCIDLSGADLVVDGVRGSNCNNQGLNLFGTSSQVQIRNSEFDHDGGTDLSLQNTGGIVVSPAGAFSMFSVNIGPNNLIHDNNNGVNVFNSSNSANPVRDVSVFDSQIYANANDAITATAATSTGGVISGFSARGNQIMCNGWPANGVGFPASCSAGFLQNGSLASAGGAGVDIIQNNDRLMKHPIVSSNQMHDNAFEAVALTSQCFSNVTVTGTNTVTYNNGPCQFNTGWKAGEVVSLNNTAELIASVSSPTVLTIQGSIANAAYGFGGPSVMDAIISNNEGVGNGSGTVGPCFFVSGTSNVAFSGNVARGCNLEGYAVGGSHITFNGDSAISNDVGSVGGHIYGFHMVDCFACSAQGVHADDPTAVPTQTTGFRFDTATTNSYVISDQLYGSTAAFVNSGGSTNWSMLLGVWTRGAATDTVGAGAAAGNCTVGSTYHNSTAASASTALYVCQPANTWTAVTVP